MKAVALLLVCGGLLQTCTPLPSREEQILIKGELRVATVNGPTTYYVGPAGPTGFEYQLAREFADSLGVTLTPVVVANAPRAVQAVRDGQADFVAAGLGVTPMLASEVRFTQPLLTVVPQIVYRAGGPVPKSLDALDGRLVVVADSAHAEHLRRLSVIHPQLQWEETRELEAEELLRRVAEGELDFTVANSDLIAINQRYYPDLRSGPAVAESQALAWAFPRRGDETLYGAARDFLRRFDGQELARLRDRYFGHVEQVDYLGAVALAEHYSTRLPRYRETFIEAGRTFGLDWRLLAAIAYQESVWVPGATSHTGVRGLMQLTMDTASFVDVADRTDPTQSIWGGARYFRWLLDQLPEDIVEPDRTWLALAAYNMGLGHLLDAQALTEQRGGDPHRWLDVRNALPLLTQSRWYSQTRFGYARGYQAMHYVGNVRTYFDMLVWMADDGVAEIPIVEPILPEQPPPQDSLAPPLDLSSPVI